MKIYTKAEKLLMVNESSWYKKRWQDSEQVTATMLAAKEPGGLLLHFTAP